MPTTATEAPTWAISRAATFQSKHMDEDALVPFDKLPPHARQRQRGRWLAYTFTLDDPKRAYVYDTAVNAVREHAKGYSSYTLADLGAGTGQNTVKTGRALNAKTTSGQGHLYLVEQSGTALSEAGRLFSQNSRAGLSGISIKLVQKDVTATELPSGSMDAVTCVNVWHHLPTWASLMAITDEIDRLLKPGGLLVVIDTRPLPKLPLRRFMIASSIRRVVNYEQFVKRAQSEGVVLDDNMKAGIADFCRVDAFRAFENALTREQFAETLHKSALHPYLEKLTDLTSPNPLLKRIYPPLNLAIGIKR